MDFSALSLRILAHFAFSSAEGRCPPNQSRWKRARFTPGDLGLAWLQLGSLAQGGKGPSAHAWPAAEPGQGGRGSPRPHHRVFVSARSGSAGQAYGNTTRARSGARVKEPRPRKGMTQQPAPRRLLFTSAWVTAPKPHQTAPQDPAELPGGRTSHPGAAPTTEGSPPRSCSDNTRSTEPTPQKARHFSSTKQLNPPSKCF